MSEREILCDECGDVAIEVPGDALGEDLDGIHCCCQGCNVDGKIVWLDDADEAGAYTRLNFRKLTEAEESELAALACEVQDEVELEVDRMFRNHDAETIARALVDDGYVSQWMSSLRGPGLAKCGPKKSDLPN